MAEKPMTRSEKIYLFMIISFCALHISSTIMDIVQTNRIWELEQRLDYHGVPRKKIVFAEVPQKWQEVSR